MASSEGAIAFAIRAERYLLRHYFRLLQASSTLAFVSALSLAGAAAHGYMGAGLLAGLGLALALWLSITLVTLDSNEARRRYARLSGYVESVREYAVSNLEPLRETVDALHDVVVPKPPKEVPKEGSERDERPLKTKERNTLLAIIALLCKESKIDYSRPAQAAVIIKSAADRHGISVGETTIEEHLKRIPDALESRSR